MQTVVCYPADEDFVLDDEDMDYRELSSEGSDVAGARRRRGSVDSDFVADEDDSGSDWESAARKPVKPKVCMPGIAQISLRQLCGHKSWRKSANFFCVLLWTKFHWSDTNRFLMDLSQTVSQPSCRIE